MRIGYFPKRLLDSRKNKDYLYLFLIGIIPIVFSYFLGLNNSIKLTEEVTYKGYWESLNWMIFPLTLPLSLWLLREIANKIFGLPCKYDNQYYRKVPILSLYQNKQGDIIKDYIQNKLRRIALDKINYVIIFVADLFIHIIDRLYSMNIYLSYYQNNQYAPPKCYPELDWEIFFTINNFAQKYLLNLPPDYREVNININLLFSVFAYLNQFIIVFIALTAIILLFRFNLFYLSRIYIRSRVHNREDSRKYITLNFEDNASRFGLSELDCIFNLQITILIVAGVVLLFSRYANVSPEYYSLGDAVSKILESEQTLKTFRETIENINIKKIFPDTGQWIIAIMWLLAVLLVFMPSLVKFLPLGLFKNPIVFLNNIFYGINPVNYLQEFIPPEKEINRYDFSLQDNVKWVAKQFKEQSFWPIGDNNAHRLFWFAFIVFYVLLIPLRISVTKFSDFINIILVVFLAFVTSFSLLNILKRLLGSYLDVPES